MIDITLTPEQEAEARRFAAIIGKRAEEEALNMARIQAFGRAVRAGGTGPLLRRPGAQVGMERVDNWIALTDAGNGLDHFMATNFPRAIRIVDFRHASEYVHDCAKAYDASAAESLAEQWCHQLKHEGGAALLACFESLDREQMTATAQEQNDRALGYFRNHHHDRMDYPAYLAKGWQIGTGAVESACKTVINQRLNMEACAGAQPARTRSAICARSFAALPTNGTASGQNRNTPDRKKKRLRRLDSTYLSDAYPAAASGVRGPWISRSIRSNGYRKLGHAAKSVSPLPPAISTWLQFQIGDQQQVNHMPRVIGLVHGNGSATRRRHDDFPVHDRNPPPVRQVHDKGQKRLAFKKARICSMVIRAIYQPAVGHRYLFSTEYRLTIQSKPFPASIAGLDRCRPPFHRPARIIMSIFLTALLALPAAPPAPPLGRFDGDWIIVSIDYNGKYSEAKAPVTIRHRRLILDDIKGQKQITVEFDANNRSWMWSGAKKPPTKQPPPEQVPLLVGQRIAYPGPEVWIIDPVSRLPVVAPTISVPARSVTLAEPGFYLQTRNQLQVYFMPQDDGGPSLVLALERAPEKAK